MREAVTRTQMSEPAFRMKWIVHIRRKLDIDPNCKLSEWACWRVEVFFQRAVLSRFVDDPTLIFYIRRKCDIKPWVNTREGVCWWLKEQLLRVIEERRNCGIKLDVSPCTRVREALWWRLKNATLYDQKCSTESTREWFSWMFFHWLRTGRWESIWSEPNSLTPNQKADPCFQNKSKVSGTNRRGLRLWLWHVLAHRKTDYACEYCWDRFPAAG